ncbi:MAG: hypothetical protein GXP43_00390 [bacterium]|nr:hypothetical protein [bacterium]
MIKLKKDFFIISIMSALVVVIWFVFGMFLSINREDVLDANLNKLIKFPKYKVDEQLFRFLSSKTYPVDKAAVYDARVQPFNLAMIKKQLAEAAKEASGSPTPKQASPSGASQVLNL